MNDKIDLLFSNNSLENAIISGGGYTYDISKPPVWKSTPLILKISRVDPKTDAKTVIAEVHYKLVGRDRIRFRNGLGSEEWIEVTNFLEKPSSLTSMRVYTPSSNCSNLSS